jgi:hypothetical protein
MDGMDNIEEEAFRSLSKAGRTSSFRLNEKIAYVMKE